MNILGIDCSTDSLLVAVRRGRDRPDPPKHPFREPGGHDARNGTVILDIGTGLRHIQRVLPAVDICLREAGLTLEDLDLLACTAGPGSFTGLRIALATVKGLSAALVVPFVLVPTTDCLAADWEGTAPVVIPLLNAQRGRFYAAVYERGTRISDYLDLPLTALLRMADPFPEVLFVSPGADLVQESVAARQGMRSARKLGGAGGRGLLALAEARYLSAGPDHPGSGPLYVRRSDAEEQEDPV
ncbi:MAG TPA: tRNA (adenosine(37)-N6)-threonylcarbamoyltransferase complex dimerization subunit type 1 TsaB [Magnetospirillaceae bacterium]|nr:tRNA (adenosine(37)-N6)-threonylcarbamoyltransferase complex dimerization subunit type 1 TsaB [Magnetospirillaceae bacterium]